MVQPYIGGLEPTHGFADVDDTYQCTAVRAGRRCQLYATHDPAEIPHGHGVPGRMVHRRFRPGTWHRWTDDAAWEQEPGSERLAWCCLGHG